jgi:hypothetical protein
MEENARSRAFIERLLRHQAFTPFLEELSRDESLQPKAPMASMPSTSTPVVAAPAPAPFQNQQFGGVTQSENTHVGMTMVPETQFDFAALNINNRNWGVNNGFGFQQPSVFAVHELPEGPMNPLDTSAMSGKGYSAVFDAEDESTVEEVKPMYPVIERPVQSEKPTSAAPVVEEDDEDDLYSSSPAPSSSATTPAAPLENYEVLLINAEKALSHYTLVVADEAQEACLAERLERRIAATEHVLQRVAALTSMLDL